MRKKWEPMEVVHNFSGVSNEEYQLILAEFAGMIYRHFSQLQIDSKLGHVHESPLMGTERTGTNA